MGIDLHKNYFVVHAEDNSGAELFKGKFDCTHEAICKVLSEFDEHPKVVVEATRNWMWFVKALQKEDCDVIMAHPFRLKAIAAAKIKTDKVDSKILCQLLRANLVPSSYIASSSEIDDREISRARMSLVKQKTKLKNLVLALLAKDNIKHKFSDLFGKAGRVWLSEVNISDSKKLALDSYLITIDSLDSQILKLDLTIKQRCSGCPRARLLNTIPGIGSTTAFLLASEIGDIKRFKSSRSFASYFGLVPRLSQSGNHAYYGRITKVGNPYVRWALVQLAHRITRMSPNWARWRDRLAYRAGKKKATVAVARKLSCAIYAILKNNIEYNQSLVLSQ